MRLPLVVCLGVAAGCADLLGIGEPSAAGG
jgi:hypothetical protein